MLDLEPASRVLAGLIRKVRHDRLGSPTPCQGVTVEPLGTGWDRLRFRGAVAGG